MRAAPTQTSREWREYYERNAVTLLHIPWERGSELTSQEREVIAESIRGFQAGESSEGRHLYRAAEAYSQYTGDHEYLAAIKLFIAEEQRHARDLATFMELNGISTLQTTFPDRVFRWMRHAFAGLEISVAVLVTAEIIAKVYYAALRASTESEVLRTLCDQILNDEEQHVAFQCEYLVRLRSSRRKPLKLLTMALQRFLYWGTCLVVWYFHCRVFRAAGFTFRSFWRACWLQFNNAFDSLPATASQVAQSTNAA